MSRKREPEDPNELLTRAKANGYRRGEHREQDAVLNRQTHVNKTIYDQYGRIAPLRGVRPPRTVITSHTLKIFQMRADKKEIAHSNPIW